MGGFLFPESSFVGGWAACGAAIDDFSVGVGDHKRHWDRLPVLAFLQIGAS